MLTVILLGFFAKTQVSEAMRLKDETIYLSDELKKSKKRTEEVVEDAINEASRAVRFEAQTVLQLDKIRELEKQLKKCK